MTPSYYVQKIRLIGVRISELLWALFKMTKSYANVHRYLNIHVI